MPIADLPEWLYIIVLTTLAGACIPLGGVLATVKWVMPRWLEKEFRHFVIALGGGILVGAVALVLVPEGLHYLHNSLWSIPLLIGGGVLFFLLERHLGLQRREAPQFTGMLLDYVPESLALGGILATGSGAAGLLALLIGLQNLPEGFNAFRELNPHRGKGRNPLSLMLLLVPIGPIVGLIGYFTLARLPGVLGAIMLLSAGGILYLIFQDIAPQSRLNRHWAPPIGAVIGFAMAMAGGLLTSA